MIKLIPKKWGHEEIMVNTEKYCGKYLFVNYGYQVSFHYHQIKDETFYVLEGIVELMIGNDTNEHVLTYVLQPGEQFRIKPGMIHSFITTTPFAKILEISTHDMPADSYRVTSSQKIIGDDGKLNRVKPGGTKGGKL